MLFTPELRKGAGMEDNRWTYAVRLPRSTQKMLKKWALENDTNLQDMGIEALLDFARKKGIKLPPLAENANKDQDRVTLN
jgi:hypothetical protein